MQSSLFNAGWFLLESVQEARIRPGDFGDEATPWILTVYGAVSALRSGIKSTYSPTNKSNPVVT